VTDSVSFILQDVATGEAGASERAELESRLRVALDQAAWGEPDARGAAATRTVATILEHAAGESGASLDRTRAQAIKALANITAGELYRELALGTTTASGDRRDAAVRASPSGELTASWRLLGGFDYKKGAPLPPAVRDLDGAAVTIDGYMLTLAETNNIRTFLLVESLWGCCFGKPPDLHQGIVVRKVGGSGIEYLFTPIRVSGRLEVGEKRERGVVASVYRLAATKVEPAPP